MPFYTPLRYPGGKRRLANFVKLVLVQNKLMDGHYVEPHGGGAAIALELLFEEFVSNVHINDLSRSVYAFWHSVLNETEALCVRIQQTPVTVDEWHQQRSVQDRALEVPLLDLGFSTFFMNRTNRSGIIAGGIIGGKNQTGPFGLDVRYHKEELVQRIRRIARYRSRINLYNLDAAVLIKTVLPGLPHPTLIYMDPPYYAKGQDLYQNSYDHNSHVELSQQISQVDKQWIVTYDNTVQTARMYEGFRSIVYDLHYTAADRYQGSEIMFFSNELTIPDAVSPAKVDRRLINRIQPYLPLQNTLGKA